MVHFCENVSYHLPGFHTDKILDMQIPPKEDPFCFCNLWEWWKLPVHNLQEFMIIGNTLACPKSNCKAEHHPEKKLANSSCSVNQCKHWNHNRCISKNLLPWQPFGLWDNGCMMNNRSNMFSVTMLILIINFNYQMCIMIIKNQVQIHTFKYMYVFEFVFPFSMLKGLNLFFSHLFIVL